MKKRSGRHLGTQLRRAGMSPLALYCDRVRAVLGRKRMQLVVLPAAPPSVVDVTFYARHAVLLLVDGSKRRVEK